MRQHRLLNFGVAGPFINYIQQAAELARIPPQPDSLLKTISRKPVNLQPQILQPQNRLAIKYFDAETL